jgi:hypothetical protein
VIDQQCTSSVTRRRVVTTGAKLAYTAPLVAASYRLGSGLAAAASPVCVENELCGNGHPCCFCLSNNNVLNCYQDQYCEDAPQCSDSEPCSGGGLCVPADKNFCPDNSGHCLYLCTGDCPGAAGANSFAASVSASVLGLL